VEKQSPPIPALRSEWPQGIRALARVAARPHEGRPAFLTLFVTRRGNFPVWQGARREGRRAVWEHTARGVSKRNAATTGKDKPQWNGCEKCGLGHPNGPAFDTNALQLFSCACL
jgi:hypothetical protein